MRKKNQKYIWIILGIAFLLVIVYGGNQGWFKSIINFNQPNQTLSVTPVQQTPTYSSCSQVCSNQGFSKYYNFISSCKDGESKVVYGYVGQPPILTCCCYNEAQTPTCTDSDGDDRDTPGHVTYAGETFTDKCLDVGNGVTEYICDGGHAVAKNYACDLGETCIQTRSGGHCVTSAPQWHPGDTVFSGSGSGSITGGTVPIGASIDLADYGITTGGNCLLGARIQTSWSYATPSTCAGIQGMEGVKWDFYDSNGLEYSRIDSSPTGLGIDLHPTSHYLEWDGNTDWRGFISKTLNLPACNVDYEYNIEIYIYSCS